MTLAPALLRSGTDRVGLHGARGDDGRSMRTHQAFPSRAMRLRGCNRERNRGALWLNYVPLGVSSFQPTIASQEYMAILVSFISNHTLTALLDSALSAIRRSVFPSRK